MNKGDKVYIKSEIDECCMYGDGLPELYEILTMHYDDLYIDEYGKNIYMYFLSNHKEYTEDQLIKERDLIFYFFKVIDTVKSFAYKSLSQKNLQNII